MLERIMEHIIDVSTSNYPKYILGFNSGGITQDTVDSDDQIIESYYLPFSRIKKIDKFNPISYESLLKRSLDFVIIWAEVQELISKDAFYSGLEKVQSRKD